MITTEFMFMRQHEAIQKIENDLESLLNLDDNQCLEVTHLIGILPQILPSNTHFTVAQVNQISFLARERILYPATHTHLDFSDFIKAIPEVFNNRFNPEYFILPSSLLAALYYLNDIIAGSTAMGRGLEESIVPDNQHCDTIKQLLLTIREEKYKPISNQIEYSRHTKANKQYAHLLPLIFDIAETAYARLAQWRCDNIEMKQKNVDTFYANEAEFCMAKGSLWILRALINLPYEFCSTLNNMQLSMSVMSSLKNCSDQSIQTIIQSKDHRRYRSGNSADTWLNNRKTVRFEEAIRPQRLLSIFDSEVSYMGDLRSNYSSSFSNSFK